MIKKFSRLIYLSIFLLIMSANLVYAHEFIVKPKNFNLKKDKTISFSVISAHIFMNSEEIEPIDKVEIFLFNGAKNIKLKTNEKALTLEGNVKIEKKGVNILCGHRKGVVWTQTTKGWKQAGKKGLKGVISSNKYEKFSKAIIYNKKSDDGYDTKIGQKLEIIPITDPAKLKVGDEIKVQILFDNKPMKEDSTVNATYDGFSSNPNTYAYSTVTNDKGFANIKITHKGIWMVRVENKIDVDSPDYDGHIIRAVLLFEVN